MRRRPVEFRQLLRRTARAARAEIPLAARLRRRRRIRRLFAEFERLAQHTPARFSLQWKDRFPVLDEDTGTSSFDRHYVYHLAWAARILAEARPARHVDLSSSLYFSTMVSAFVPTEFYDLRPARLDLDRLVSGRADLLDLPFADGAIESLSCLHVVEHVGLGRYGDALDPEGDARAMAELERVLAPGGSLLFVVPVGRPRIVFNAHRIYSFAQVRSSFAGFELTEFALVPDDPAVGLVRHAEPELADRQAYGCGCFLFRRPSASNVEEQLLEPLRLDRA